MSTRGETLYHPVNQSTEETWNGFSWPALFFGVVWLAIKGLWIHFVVSLLLILITSGFGAPIIWIVYGFIGNDAHKNSLIKKGYLTASQVEEQKLTAATSTSARSNHSSEDNFEKLRKLGELRSSGVLTDEEFAAQKAKILRT